MNKEYLLNLQFFAGEESEPEVSHEVETDSGQPEEFSPDNLPENVKIYGSEKTESVKKEEVADSHGKKDSERNLEKDSIYAEARRKFESEQQKAQEDRDNRYKETFGHLGINSEKEYFEALERERINEIRSRAEFGDMNALNELVNMGVQEKLNVALQYEKTKNQVEEQARKELFELNEAYGTKFQNTKELVDSDKGGLIIQLMSIKKQDGSFMTAKEAYETIHPDLVKDKIKQQTLNRANGYNHMKNPKSISDGDKSFDLTKDELEAFKQFGIKPNPEILKKVVIK